MQTPGRPNALSGAASSGATAAGHSVPRRGPGGGRAFWLAIVLLALGWFLLAPVLTAREMRAAARRGDAEKLSKHVDYDALRESLKAQIASELQADSALAGYEAASRVFGAIMAEAAVDVVVTPEMVATLLTGSPPDPATDRLFDQAERSGSAQMIMEQYRDTSADRQRRERVEQLEKNVKVSMGYETLNRFVVKAGSKTDDEPAVALIFLRRGMGWKLAGARMQKT